MNREILIKRVQSISNDIRTLSKVVKNMDVTNIPLILDKGCYKTRRELAFQNQPSALFYIVSCAFIENGKHDQLPADIRWEKRIT